MPTHAEVAKSFWTRSARHWSDQEKLLGLYILSGPHSTSEGYYRLPLGYIVDDLGWEGTQVSTTMQGLADRQFVCYDLGAQVVFVCKRLEYRQPRGENQIRGALNAVREVPPSSLLGLFIAAAQRHAAEFAEALCKAFPDTPSQGLAIPLPRGFPRAGARVPGLSPTPTPNKEATPPVDPDRIDGARSRLQEIHRVFDVWVEATERNPERTKFLPDRRRVIEKALKSHGVDVCLAAVRNIGRDAWARGANDRGKRFDDIKHALGSTERIERWSEGETANRDDPNWMANYNAKAAATAGART